MKDYYNIIIELCSHLNSADDMGDKKKVRAHNKAHDELRKLIDELDTPEGAEILFKLLFHENDHVILSAAMLCWELKIHENELRERIKYVRETSQDRMVRFEAGMMLEVWHLDAGEQVNNKLPIYYEENTQQLVEDFINSNFGNSGDGQISHEIVSEYVHSDVHAFSSNKSPGNNVYVTCGMGAREQNSPLNEYKRIEFVMVSGSGTKNDMTIINQLIFLTKFPFENNTWLGAWHTIDALDDFKNKFGYSAFLILPEILGQIDVPEFTNNIKFLGIVPIYKNECEALVRCDESRNKFLQVIESNLCKRGFEFLKVDSRRENLFP